MALLFELLHCVDELVELVDHLEGGQPVLVVDAQELREFVFESA